MMKIEAGFYYHYRHDLSGTFNNYAYEIMGIGHHTEIDGLEDSAMVIYRPIYESPVYNAGKHWDLRPIKIFMGSFTIGGKTLPRFSKITDPKIISSLEKVRDQMYGE